MSRDNPLYWSVIILLSWLVAFGMMSWVDYRHRDDPNRPSLTDRALMATIGTLSGVVASLWMHIGK